MAIRRPEFCLYCTLAKMQEFILKKVWDEDVSEMVHMIEDHIEVFVKILRS